jgi:hypothetical protein
MNYANSSPGARYATSFKEQLFGGKCDVEVVVDLATRAPSSVLSMSSFLSSQPVFSISLESLKLLALGITDIKNHARLLSAQITGTTDHQLNCTVGGATAIVVQPAGKPARFTLTIGAFHREGLLEEIAIGEIDEAITKMDALQNRVVEKVVGRTHA